MHEPPEFENTFGIMLVNIGGRKVHHRTVSFDEAANAVLLIEQRLLPHEFRVDSFADFRSTAAAITDMVVRGAGAIGATAAYGYAQGLIAYEGSDVRTLWKHENEVFETLKNARPTAVDPVNAMLDIRAKIRGLATVDEIKRAALAEAHAFADEDVAHCEAIGRHGAPLIEEGMRVLTHCNAGWLAFVDVGSATAPMYEAQNRGVNFHVFATRPDRVLRVLL